MNAELIHDGWDGAFSYHWMIREAAKGSFTMIMPEVIGEDGAGLTFRTPYVDDLWSLVDARPSVRRAGYAAFSVAANTLARQHVARNNT